jgi:8-oxo-dGTP diphosphatase
MKQPTELTKYTKLNLACGPLNRFPEPWLNVDLKSDVADIEMDIHKLPEEWTGQFWEVRASHVIEHFFTSEWPEVLREWLRVLKPGGTLRLAMPDLRIIVDNLLTENGKDLKGRPTLSLTEKTAVLSQIYGIDYDTDNTEKRWRHRIVVDDVTVIDFLEQLGGIENVQRVAKRLDSAALHDINDDSQNSWSMTIAGQKAGDAAVFEVKAQDEFSIDALTEVPTDKPVSAVFAFAYNQMGQLLVVRNERGWDIPGGHVEDGETPEEALHREVAEEAFATIGNPRLFVSANAEKHMLFYVADVTELQSFTAENETDQREFMHPTELVSLYGGGKPELMTQLLDLAERLRLGDTGR